MLIYQECHRSGKSRKSQLKKIVGQESREKSGKTQIMVGQESREKIRKKIVGQEKVGKNIVCQESREKLGKTPTKSVKFSVMT